MYEQARLLHPQLVQWRRALHQMPEVGTKLPGTVTFVQEKLREMGISYQLYDDISCVLATVGSGGKCFLLRADMDALPVREEADVPFRATNGCMHACGHDLHTAMLLGAARLLKEHEADLRGTVKLLFQSGEENFTGAEAAVHAGVLENPKVNGALALHVIAMMPVGTVLTGERPMAAVDPFRMALTGRGGHGSMPETCIDPINAAVQVYLALQSLVAREVGGTQEAVLTVGQLAAGESTNVIPQRAVLQGTLRTFDPQLRQYLKGRIRQISSAVAAAYRCDCETELLPGCPGVVTDDAVTAGVIQCVRRLWPDFSVLDRAHGMGSEDFAQISQRVPSAYLMVGAGVFEESRRFPQHHPKVEFSEDVLPIGAALYASAAMDYLRE